MLKALHTLTLSLIVYSLAAAAIVHLKNDPLTQLPLPESSDKSPFGNEPTAMPATTVCQSKFQGNVYSVIASPLGDTVSWYSGALKDFSHIQSADQGTHVFADAQRSLVVIVMGKPGGRTYSVAYQKYEPGLSQKALVGITKRTVDCT